MKQRRMIMHPAWQAAHELLSDSEKWFRTVVIEDGRGYTAAQVAGAMRLLGWADDVIVRYEGFTVAGYELPAIWIPFNESDSLDGFPGLMATVKWIAELPTLEEALDDPAGFVAGFEEVGRGTAPLGPEFASALLKFHGQINGRESWAD